MQTDISVDPQLQVVATALLGISGFKRIVAKELRRALDEVIDGPRTGRYSVEQLEKTEKTYIGTKVEILIRCSVSCDHIPRRSWALFRARDVMRGVIESFKAEQAA